MNYFKKFNEGLEEYIIDGERDTADELTNRTFTLKDMVRAFDIGVDVCLDDLEGRSFEEQLSIILLTT